ncbi:MAG: ribonuclease T [Alteromonadaceae bacterium]|uniref:Ribonuclease T n=1 Tax=Paraglaciecola mesophila KMM 241 TaxID=1128912 RepID=K6ZPJ8_9ALTE|nr:ribonuclease T [Paraglaciecola mesophila]MAD16074.1 ribonuclease T [Alteromonadaceae bacterium]GAC25270.1 ribonuclease T [Paraglaciecola mesophila KMM 241]|tara:strand:+ start:2344 stop:2979 length:636 start_codon:yes stop_codon:yes gene_type:complete
MSDPQFLLKDRFRGYFPVIVDVETAGFNAQTDALLEVAAITTKMDADGFLTPDKTFHYHVVPFEGANLEKAALEFNGIDPWCALRGALDETEVMKDLCKQIRKEQKNADCQRSVMVAHNAAFDLGFINAAIERSKIKRTPFHPFVSFDTTTLSGLALGQTVLVKACQAANISFNQSEAHSALYDTQKTAELYCYIVNKWQSACGWPTPEHD